ncbi:hypothetical protein BJ138DRAFT_512528 [Hygrophoropsis aurantiaca]|uniref:Uncharacterized protein n=1 Tax=Hygrophoropsis aurantiaca TaxID=72124 RepID=A0ACB8A2V7_9AGAM|nr:hypothetical protein BJ138DRAFT_512528 [Hygrophoropsis aurantiaca]
MTSQSTPIAQLFKQPTHYPILPVEIWRECWRLCRRPELRALSLVCKAFTHLCQSILFGRMTLSAPSYFIDGKNVGRTIRRLEGSSSRLLSLINPSGAFYSNYLRSVKEWRFYGNDLKLDLIEYMVGEERARDVENAYHNTLGIFIQTLPTYQNLHSLELWNIDIDESVRTSLACLPKLEVFDAFQCQFTARNGPLLCLRICDLRSCGLGQGPDSDPGTEPINFVAPEKLQELVIKSAFGIIDLFLPAFLALQPFNYLTSITYDIRFPETLVNFYLFLERSPSLIQLEVNQLCAIDPEAHPQRLPPSIIPKLRVFAGPLHIARVLVPGRPVQVLCLHYLAIQSTDMGHIILGMHIHGIASINITLLTLKFSAMTCGLGLFAYIKHWFPNLRQLNMNFYGKVESSESAAIGSHPRLNNFTSNGPPYDGSASDGPADEESDECKCENGGDWGGSSDGGSYEAPYHSETVSDRSASGRIIHRPKRYLDVNHLDRSVKIGPLPLDEKGFMSKSPYTFLGMIDWIAMGHGELPSQIVALHITSEDNSPYGNYTVPWKIPNLRTIIIELIRGRWSVEGAAGAYLKDLFRALMIGLSMSLLFPCCRMTTEFRFFVRSNTSPLIL